MYFLDIFKSNSDFNARYSNIKHVAENALVADIGYISNEDNGKVDIYTNHDAKHCDRILKTINEFITEFNVELNEVESFLLCCSVWLHDIGMFEFPPNSYFEDVRKSHHKKSIEFLYDKQDLLKLAPAEAAIICHIINAHRKSESIEKVPEEMSSNNEDCRVQFLASILRLADGCDITKLRTPEIIRLIHNDDDAKGGISDESIKQFEKHKYVSRLKFEPCSQSIVLETTLEKKQKLRRIQKNLLKHARDSVKEELYSVCKILNENNVTLLNVYVKTNDKGKHVIIGNPIIIDKPSFSIREFEINFHDIGCENGFEEYPLSDYTTVRSYFCDYPAVNQISDDFESKIENNYFIISSKGYGKTSLLSKMSSLAVKNGYRPLWIRLFNKSTGRNSDVKGLFDYLNKQNTEDVILVIDDIHLNEHINLSDLNSIGFPIWYSSNVHEYYAFRDDKTKWKDALNDFEIIKLKSLNEDDISYVLDEKFNNFSINTNDLKSIKQKNDLSMRFCVMLYKNLKNLSDESNTSKIIEDTYNYYKRLMLEARTPKRNPFGGI